MLERMIAGKFTHSLPCIANGSICLLRKAATFLSKQAISNIVGEVHHFLVPPSSPSPQVPVMTHLAMALAGCLCGMRRACNKCSHATLVEASASGYSKVALTQVPQGSKHAVVVGTKGAPSGCCNVHRALKESGSRYG